MTFPFKLLRRSFLIAGSSTAALAALGLTPQAFSNATSNTASHGLKLGQARPFSFEALIDEAKTMAVSPYAPPPALPRDVLERIDYDAHGKIRFGTENALFKDGPGLYPITFFHLGSFFQTIVHMHVLETSPNAQMAAREILYAPAYFDMPENSPAHELPANTGFAGFRVQESRLDGEQNRDWRTNDWAAFLGASYFRAIGELYQYGLSARGVAVNTAVSDEPEEFPAFTHFYFAPQGEVSDQVLIYALLESPSMTGAYRFALTRANEVVMDIDAHLFLRKDVKRLGLAPMTSMYWFSETNKAAGVKEWRPEVHDSDGLAMWSGSGEYIWRALNNPGSISVSSFTDNNPRGFGLLQRDRAFDHYLDGVAYDRRPSLWVEPAGNWGKGSIQLVELSTGDETNDNIVAFWVPEKSAKAGDEYALRYRLYWNAEEPFPPDLARCTATRMGMGGQPGQDPRPENIRKFVIEFLGGPLTRLPYGAKPQPVLSSSRGQFTHVFTEAVPGNIPGHWRVQFDFMDEADASTATDLRLYLKLDDQPLTETWLYQYQPQKK